ncbi:hypothetical protein BH11MYX2_BH11MYX2_34940 [soil metagenome]
MNVLERVQVVPRPRSEVFEFFANAENLQKLTPPSLSFQILSPTPIEMKPGARIDYRIKLQGVPMKWRTKIEAYEPGERFIDVQERGPYKTWHHTHTFRDVPGGTEIRDRVEYELPFGPLGAIAHKLFVKRQLRQIFDYRTKVMQERFG